MPLQATGRTAAGLVGAVSSAIAIVSFSSIASNRLILYLRLGFSLTQNKISYLTKLNIYAEMAERSNAAVLKTVDGQLSGGSNPSLCANKDVN